MQTEDLIVDQRRQGQIIEQVREKLPNVGIPILSQTLVVEPINLGDLPRLVVTPEDGHSISVTEFQGDEQGDGLDRVVASVDVVAHEEVVGVGGVASDAEELGEVVELSMNITTDGNRALDGLDIGLLHEDFPSLVAQLFHFTLTQGFTVHQLGDPDVWVFRRVGHGGQGEGRGPFPS